MRVTNNSDMNPEDISAVFRTESGGYRVILKNGQSKTFRRVQLTEEARQLFDQIGSTSTWEKMGG